MAKITIGGKEYTIPEMNFYSLERCWPYVEEVMTTLDPMKGPGAGLSIIAAALMEDENFKKEEFNIKPEVVDEDKILEGMVFFMKKKLKAIELPNIKTTIDLMMEEAGLDAPDTKSGEAAAAADQTQNPSTETALASSSSLSPPAVKEEVGTK